MTKTGTYTGNGLDDHDVDIGIDLASKACPYVIIKAATGNVAAKHRTEYGQGDLTMGMDNTDDFANGIQSFTATGFQVGTNVAVNADGVTFRYIAFWQEG